MHTTWEYLWRRTYWSEASRQGDYVQWIRYSHVWRADPDGGEESFPGESGLDHLGRQGWELVALTPSQISLVTSVSPQQGDTYSTFTVYTLIFKRPAST